MKIKPNLWIAAVVVTLLQQNALAKTPIGNNQMLVGIRVQGNLASINEAIIAGAKELLIELPPNEESAVQILQFL